VRACVQDLRERLAAVLQQRAEVDRLRCVCCPSPTYYLSSPGRYRHHCFVFVSLTFDGRRSRRGLLETWQEEEAEGDEDEEEEEDEAGEEEDAGEARGGGDAPLPHDFVASLTAAMGGDDSRNNDTFTQLRDGPAAGAGAGAGTVQGSGAAPEGGRLSPSQLAKVLTPPGKTSPPSQQQQQQQQDGPPGGSGQGRRPSLIPSPTGRAAPASREGSPPSAAGGGGGGGAAEGQTPSKWHTREVL